MRIRSVEHSDLPQLLALYRFPIPMIQRPNSVMPSEN